VEAEFKRVSEAKQLPWTTNLDYPRDIKRERDNMNAVRERKSTVVRDYQVLDTFYNDNLEPEPVPVMRPKKRDRPQQQQQQPLDVVISTVRPQKRPAAATLFDQLLDGTTEY
jgi:hypothetical protein